MDRLAATPGSGVSKLWGGERLTGPRSLELVRLRVQLIATGTPSAYVRLYAAVRDFSMPHVCGCTEPRRSAYELTTGLASAVSPGDSPLFDLADVHDAIPHDALAEARRLSAMVSHLPVSERATAVRERLAPAAQKQLDSFIDRVGQLPPALRATLAVRMGAYASDDVDGATGGPASRVGVSEP